MPPKKPPLTIAGVPLDKGATLATHPKHPGLKAGWLYITPEIAARWLTYNLMNRNANEHNINAWFRDLEKDAWLIDGNSIRFTTDEDWDAFEMLDGQTRCKAIAQGRRTVMSLVAVGIDPQARWVMDSGSGRTVAHYLQMEKVKYASVTAGLARRWLIWQEPDRRLQIGRDTPSHTEQLEFYFKNAELLSEAAYFAQQAARRAHQQLPAIGVNVWGLAWLAFTTGKAGRENSEFFLAKC
jgi:hypothetical protein